MCVYVCVCEEDKDWKREREGERDRDSYLVEMNRVRKKRLEREGWKRKSGRVCVDQGEREKETAILRKSCQSQPHWPDSRIIKGDGNYGMVLGFFKTQRRTELVLCQFKMKCLVRRFFHSIFSSFFVITSSCDFAGKRKVWNFLDNYWKNIFHWKLGSFALRLLKEYFFSNLSVKK